MAPWPVPTQPVHTHVEAGELRVEAEGGGLALRDAGTNHGAAVDHGTLLAHGEAAPNGEGDADHLAGGGAPSQQGERAALGAAQAGTCLGEQRLQADHAGQLDTVEVYFNLGNAAARGDRLHVWARFG